MAISCVYCGGSHERADEVRACWSRSNGAEVAGPTVATGSTAPTGPSVPSAGSRAVAPSDTSSTSSASSPVAARHQREVDDAVVLRPDPMSWAGPDALGRHLCIAPGDQVPEAWATAPHVVIDQATLADPASTLAELHRAAQHRARLVLEVGVDWSALAPFTDERALHQIGPRGELLGDALDRLVLGNSVVVTARGASFRPVTAAAAHGARLSREGEAGDVVLPDGTPRWIDGGSFRWISPIDGVGVVHEISARLGSFRPFGANDCAADLAADQLAAVTHPTGAARIIAPAGSGKTRVLTERARHLVRGWGLPAGALVLVAYNRRAQLEMHARLADVPGMQVRTLNALALAVLNGVAPFATRPARLSTVNESDVRRLLGQFVQAPRKRSVDPLAPWLAAMSTTRLGLRRPADVEDLYDGDVAGLSEVIPQYEAALRRAGNVDFDGQIVEAIRLLLSDPVARAAAQRACRLMLVDEFQDLTPAHLLLIRLLSGPAGQVFGVGDDDQTIYGYNGADPRWLIEYGELFPGAGEHPLEVNYRCPSDVVEQADRLLRRNLQRVTKVIRSGRPGTAGMHVVPPTDDPVAATSAIVRTALDQGAAPADVAVLARVNATLVPVQVALAMHGVPVDRAAGAEFLERTSIRSALAWLRLASGPEQGFASFDVAEALRRPSRSFSPRLAEWIAEQRSVDALTRLAQRLDTPRDSERVLAFAGDIVRIRHVAARRTTSEVVDLLCDDIGLAGTLATLDLNRHGMNAPSQSDDLVALRHLALLHPDPASFPTWLAEMLARPADDQGVTLATVHRVKGQEWPHVVVHLADADQFPHRLADDQAEERRVFHVAITRTSAQLSIVSGRDPSPFIAQLTTEPTAAELRPTPPTTRGAAASSATSATSTAPGRGTAGRAGSTTSTEPPAGPFTGTGVVAGPALVLVDQGQEWTVVGPDPDAPGQVLARRDGTTRAFRFGAKVVSSGKQRGPLTPRDPSWPERAPAVFDELRRLRDRVRGGKPAYTVFDDATLERIALALPTSLSALAKVKGVGPAKLEQYGDQVLGVIADLESTGDD